jgi:hypothetical protein
MVRTSVCEQFLIMVSFRGSANFSTVPAAKGARTGELPRGYEMKVDLRIPSWKEMSFLPSAGLRKKEASTPSPIPPWPDGWSQLTTMNATCSVHWAVSGISFWEDKGGLNPSALKFDLKVCKLSSL